MRLKFKLITMLFLLFANCKKNVENNDVIRFATNAEAPPFTYVDRSESKSQKIDMDNELKGFDIDLDKAIAKELKKKAEFHIMQWSDILAAIHNGKIDATASVTITYEREKNADFSKSYLEDSMAIIFRKDNPIKNKTDLENKKITALLGSIPEIFAQKNIKNSKIISSNGDLISMELLKAKHVDAIIISTYQAIKLLENNKCCEYKLIQKNESGRAIAVRKNSPLLQEINQALDNLEKKGIIKELEKKWFGEIDMSEDNFLK